MKGKDREDRCRWDTRVFLWLCLWIFSRTMSSWWRATFLKGKVKMHTNTFKFFCYFNQAENRERETSNVYTKNRERERERETQKKKKPSESCAIFSLSKHKISFPRFLFFFLVSPAKFFFRFSVCVFFCFFYWLWIEGTTLIMSRKWRLFFFVFFYNPKYWLYQHFIYISTRHSNNFFHKHCSNDSPE